MLTISLVIPLHQGERFIAEAIASARSQDEPPLEVIVVDDGSSDRGPALVASIPGVVLVRQENRGPGAARNRGIDLARGDLLAFLDQDDLLRPAALRRHREVLETRPEARLSVCRQRFDLAEGESRPAWQRPELLGAEVIAWTPSCLCVRRATFAEVGRFDESLRATSDLNWIREFRQRGLPYAEIDETLVDRRVHGGCQSSDAATMRREMIAVARRSANASRGTA